MEDERVSFGFDRHRGLPRERFRRERERRGDSDGSRRPCLFGVREVADFPEAVDGAFPLRFVEWAVRLLGVDASGLLHVCSGSMGPAVGGVRVDLRVGARPDVAADGRRLPFREGSFAGVLIDPPYTVEYAESLYGTDYPRPSALLREAARVLRPCGRVGFLHFLVPQLVPGLSFVGTWGITTGLGYRIRAFTVYQREQASLF